MQQRFYCSAASGKGAGEKKTIPKNVLEGTQTAQLQAENGAIFDKKPFKIHLDESKCLKKKVNGSNFFFFYFY